MMRTSFLLAVGTLLFVLAVMTTVPSAVMAPCTVMESPAAHVKVSVVQNVQASDANTTTTANSSDGKDARRQDVRQMQSGKAGPHTGNFLAIHSQFKNEGDVLGEWVEHHLSQGVAHFHLVDNGSTDNYLKVLQPHIDKGYVTLVKDNRKWVQKMLGNMALEWARNNTEWLLSIDVDEYVYGTNETIADILRAVPHDVSALIIRWRMFGSSGHIKQPASVRKGFTRCSADFQSAHTKWVARSSKLCSFAIHFPGSCTPSRWWNECLQEMPRSRRRSKQAASNQCVSGGSDMLLHLDHYAIMSWERFQRVKMSRGDPSSKRIEFFRDEKYFKRYDSASNSTDCMELHHRANRQ